jgi:hypothetical protein
MNLMLVNERTRDLFVHTDSIYGTNAGNASNVHQSPQNGDGEGGEASGRFFLGTNRNPKNFHVSRTRRDVLVRSKKSNLIPMAEQLGSRHFSTIPKGYKAVVAKSWESKQSCKRIAALVEDWTKGSAQFAMFIL